MKTDELYIEPAAAIAGYEKETGFTASGYLAELAVELAAIINKAYEDGYKAGLEASCQ